MDYTFVFVMTILHVYYLLKLLDYSLSRIHPTIEEQLEQQEFRIRNNNKPGINDTKMLGTNADCSTKTQAAVQFVKTKYWRVCCLIKTVPKWINWQRTRACRWFLRFFLTLSVILGLILSLEFFGNIVAEFLITCIKKGDQYFYVAIIIFPFLLYSVEVLIRIVWKIVY